MSTRGGEPADAECTAELYLETVKGTTPDVPLCCSSKNFGSSSHRIRRASPNAH
ncbi:MAG: hypothetical protein O2941_05770 [Cyanobacteria bacterium]|nr:hypothetical protein [Cyanobacteriota bacterium]